MYEKIAIPLYLAALFVAFALISLFVVLSKRHPFFIEKKLRLGALILSLTGASIGCLQPTCYSPANPNNWIEVDQADAAASAIILNVSVSDTLSGKIGNRVGSQFSFAVVDSHRIVMKSGDIAALDGVFDETTEEFKIAIGTSVFPGNYFLRFYETPRDSIKSYGDYHASFPLTIVTN
jgi:hypothetical protein